MTQGGSGFTSGEDFVAARVSIDVPTEGIQSLREMSQAVDRFRTAVETAGRSSASFVSYIQQMAQAGQQATQVHQNLAAQLERTADLQQRSQTGMPGMSSSQALPMSRSAPQGYVDPWAGMGVGMGGTRSPSPGDVTQQIQSQAIDPTRQLDPRKYLNAQAGRYRIQPGELATPTGAPDWGAHADRVEQRDKLQREQEVKTPGSMSGDSGGAGGFSSQVGRAGGLANNIMREMGPGGSHMGAMGMAGQMMSRASRAAGSGSSGTATAQAANAGDAASAEEAQSGGLMDGVLGGMGGMGGLLKGLGGAGLGIGAGLAGLGAIQKGGAAYQGYKNMGLLRGGGAGEGFQDEMGMRSLALNPFISTEQSRQIIMAGLTEGFSGKQFDTVTQFMASNLKDMNVSVSDSVGMLRKNVVEGGQSIQGLGASLAMLKGLSQTGASSLPDLTQNFAATSGALIDQGVAGGPAGQQAILSGQLFANDQLLKGVGGQMLTGMSTAAMGMLKASGGANIPAGLMPNEVGPYMAAHGQNETGAMMKMVKNLVGQLFRGPARQKGSMAYFNQLSVMTDLMGKYFPGANLNQPKVADLVDQVLGGGDPTADAQKRVDSQVQQVNDPQGFGATTMQGFGAMGNSIMDVGKEFIGQMTRNSTAANNARSDIGKQWSVADYDKEAFRNPMLDQIVGQYGPGDVMVVDKNGNAKPLTGAKDQVQGLAKGDLTWKRKGEQGNGQTLAMGPQSMDQNFRNGGSTNVSFDPATVNINVNTTTGQATASPNVLALTPNQQQVNAGVGSNTMNNPQPGDGYGYRYTGTGTR